MVLVGYWPLNESSGSTAYDHSGNETHGTVNDGGDSTVPSANGILGQNAYSFDGKNDYLDFGRPESLSNSRLGSSFSFGAWIKPGNGDLDGNRHNVLGRMDSNSDDNFILQTSSKNGSTSFTIYLDDGNTTGWINSDVVPKSGIWYHTLGVYRNGKGIIYINGREMTQRNIWSGTIQSTNAPFQISDGKQSYSDYWNGKIQEVRIYNHALTPSEIQYLYTVSQRGRQVTSRKSS